MANFKLLFELGDGSFVKKTISCEKADKDAEVANFASTLEGDGHTVVASAVHEDWPAEYEAQAEYGA